MSHLHYLLSLTCALSLVASLPAADPLFSGPQVGEKLPAFKVRGALGDEAGKELDFVTAAAGKPLVLIFVHDLNRQSVSMVRVLSGYTVGRAKDGVHTGVVWLGDDATEAENTLKRISHALTPKAPTGISLEGREGPGAYGLNRNVTLTILVGKEGKVTSNFALVQPSLQVDLPKILQAIVDVAGGDVPKLTDLEGMPAMAARPAANQQDPNLRGLLTPVIRRDAAPEDVDRAAKAVEEYVAKNEATRKEVGRIANTIIDAGKLKDYGTERAQEYLQKWAKEFGGKPATSREEKTPREDAKPSEKQE
ncbi:hypothetical protein NA78x_000775 [Anatilimnocola sp. NA78]|uniref:hypothetical protein n=1 Tax=Anatilimnocola sp. NA78 TaxID=3415683 RepID=UPI003CE471AF